jgi:hypothetical protein
MVDFDDIWYTKVQVHLYQPYHMLVSLALINLNVTLLKGQDDMQAYIFLNMAIECGAQKFSFLVLQRERSIKISIKIYTVTCLWLPDE